MKRLFLLACIFSLAGCGGVENDAASDLAYLDNSPLTFWAIDFKKSTSYTYYMYGLQADKVGAGDNCCVYLERGNHNLKAADIQAIINMFDKTIYPKLRATYGDEPERSIDGDEKIYILLMNIKDDWNGISITAYTAGYFFSNDQTNNNYSNKKKILYMDINPGSPAFASFKQTLAHEFQHMIHWNKTKGWTETWLNEAMSEVAPFYAFGEANWNRVLSFESGTNHSDSLTDWGPNNNHNSTLADYAVVYMWAQYMADRFDQPDKSNPSDFSKNYYVFKDILNKGGSASLETYLQQNHGLSFDDVFRDWSIAVFFGDNNASNPVSTNNTAWTYKTINTWPGGRYNIPGLFNPAPQYNFYGNLNNYSLRPLAPWSLGYYWKDTPAQGSLTWTSDGFSNIHASLYSAGENTFEFDMIPGYSHTYANKAYLILQNMNGKPATPGLPYSSTQMETLPTPVEKLRSISQSASAASPSRGDNTEPAEPIPVCMHDFLSWRAGEIQKQIQEIHDAH